MSYDVDFRDLDTVEINGQQYDPWELVEGCILNAYPDGQEQSALNTLQMLYSVHETVRQASK